MPAPTCVYHFATPTIFKNLDARYKVVLNYQNNFIKNKIKIILICEGY